MPSAQKGGNSGNGGGRLLPALAGKGEGDRELKKKAGTREERKK